VRGHPFSHWDLWFLVVAAGQDGGWHGVVAKLEQRRRGNDGWHDAEAKLAHVQNLRERLQRAGLRPADVLGRGTPDRRAVTKARTKVFEQEVTGADKSQAMRDTPRGQLVARAKRGQWARFPCSPSEFEARLHAEIGDDYHGERGTMAMVRRLERAWKREGKHAKGDARQLALHRATMTVLLDAIEHADDSCGTLGDLFSDVFESYVGVSWEETGIEPIVYVRDMIEFGVWEEYGFTDDLETFFKALPVRYGSLADEVLVGLVPELQHHGFDYQVERTRALRAALLMAHRRFDHYLELAAEVGSSAWKPIVSMAERAQKAGKRELAEAIFRAADVPGWHRDYLRDECKRVMRRAPMAAPLLRRVK
jgi:hypothetical protein